MLRRETIQADLCVIGGGMAGLCAAIAAARENCKVVLMQERPVLGGNASSEIRMWICGANGRNNRETGILEEIMLENMRFNPTKNYYIWDGILYDFVQREKNITLLLNCTCMDSKTASGSFADGRDTRICSVTGYQMTTQTMIEVQARFYADCSGDSILAPLTGAQFMLGREGRDEFGEDTAADTHDSYTMGMSCLIQGRETPQKVDFPTPAWSTRLTDAQMANRMPVLGDSTENFWYLELGGNRDTIGDTESIRQELVPLALGFWDYVKNSGKFNADNWELDFLGFLPGKRESRRMVGEHIVTQREISDGVVFEDVVAFGGWPLDDHVPLGFYHPGAGNTIVRTPSPYTLPYRALYSKNVENLFFAGRNISMTHMAMSSVRVMATCALLGQAVGTAAAVAVRYGLTPHGVYREQLPLLQQLLLRADCFLPTRKRAVSAPCLRFAPDPALCDGQDRPHALYQTETCGVTVKNGTALCYTFPEPTPVSTVHLVFDSDLNRETLNGDACERTHATRCNTLLSSPTLIMPRTLCRSFSLELQEGQSCQVLEFSDNLRRCLELPVNRKLTGLRLIPHSNWGDTGETAVFSFDF